MVLSSNNIPQQQSIIPNFIDYITLLGFNINQKKKNGQ